MVAQHGIEDGNHLAHAGGEGDLFMFTGLDESSVGRSNDRVVLNGSKHGHEQDRAHTGATATDTTLAPQGAAVTIEWCDTDEGGDLFVGQRAKLREIGQECIDHLWTDTGRGEQDVAFITPFIDLLDQFGGQSVEFFDLGLNVAEVAADIGREGLWHDVQAVFFHGIHFDELPPSGDHVPDFSDIADRQGTDLGGHDSRVTRQQPGIDLVGLCQDTPGAGIAAHLDRLTDDDRHATFGGGQHQVILAAAGGLDHDTRQRIAGQAPEQFSDALDVIRDAEMQGPLVDGDIQLMLTDVDPDVDGVFSFLRHCSITSPLLNSGSWAHSTVRDRT